MMTGMSASGRCSTYAISSVSLLHVDRKGILLDGISVGLHTLDNTAVLLDSISQGIITVDNTVGISNQEISEGVSSVNLELASITNPYFAILNTDTNIAVSENNGVSINHSVINLASSDLLITGIISSGGQITISELGSASIGSVSYEATTSNTDAFANILSVNAECVIANIPNSEVYNLLNTVTVTDKPQSFAINANTSVSLLEITSPAVNTALKIAAYDEDARAGIIKAGILVMTSNSSNPEVICISTQVASTDNTYDIVS